MKLTLTHSCLDLLDNLLDLLRFHLLEVMLIKLGLRVISLGRFLTQRLEHLLRIHACILAIKQCTGRKHEDLTTYIDALGQIVKHQVDHIVSCLVGTLCVTLPQV